MDNGECTFDQNAIRSAILSVQNKKCMLVVVNSGLGSYLHVEGAGQLVAALCLHGFHLGVMEGVEGQVLHFTVVLVEGGLKNA